MNGDVFGRGDVLPMTETRPLEFGGEGDFRVVVVSGRPHGEAIRQRGPFVL